MRQHLAIPDGRRLVRRDRALNVWPGYVDALTTLLLSVVFLLTIFVTGQFFLSQELSGRDTVLERLNRQISELTDLLALERSGKRAVEESAASLRANLQGSEAERKRLQDLLASGQGAEGKAAELGRQLDAEKGAATRALNQVDLLNQQIAAMRQQLAALEDALAASETRDRESQARIADLGSRLNVALAQRVQELARYRSDFFGRLRQILGNRPDIRIVGDRFVLQSEVLFSAGQAVLKPEAGRRSTGSPARSWSSTGRSRPTSRGCCGSTAIPTRGRSTPRNSRRTGRCRRRAPSRSCSTWSERASRPSACWPGPSASSSPSMPGRARRPMPATGGSR